MSNATTAYILGTSLGYGVAFARSFTPTKNPDTIKYDGRTPENEKDCRSIYILGTPAIQSWANGNHDDPEFTQGIFWGGMWFDVEDSERLRAESSISQYFTETGTIITDVTTVKPVQFTVRGRISEQSNNSWDGWKAEDYTPKTLNEIQGQYYKLMSTVGLGNVSWEQRDRIGKIREDFYLEGDNALTLRNAMPDSKSFYGGVKQDEHTTGYATSYANTEDAQLRGGIKQLRATWYLLALQQLRVPVTIATPWGSLRNMIITNVESARENTPLTTLYDVTFTQQRKTKPIKLKTAGETNQTQQQADNGPLVEQTNESSNVITINSTTTITGSYTNTQ